jgi:hypothetical protein
MARFVYLNDSRKLRKIIRLFVKVPNRRFKIKNACAIVSQRCILLFRSVINDLIILEQNILDMNLPDADYLSG